MKITDIDTNALMMSLGSDTCPACGGKKIPRQTLCRSHYYKLPREMRMALYAHLGGGYRESVIAALQFLDISDFTLPPKEPRP